MIGKDNLFQLTIVVNYKSYLPLLKLLGGGIKFLKNLHGDLCILMHQIIKCLNQKLSFLKKFFILYMKIIFCPYTSFQI